MRRLSHASARMPEQGRRRRATSDRSDAGYGLGCSSTRRRSRTTRNTPYDTDLLKGYCLTNEGAGVGSSVVGEGAGHVVGAVATVLAGVHGRDERVPSRRLRHRQDCLRHCGHHTSCCPGLTGAQDERLGFGRLRPCSRGGWPTAALGDGPLSDMRASWRREGRSARRKETGLADGSWSRRFRPRGRPQRSERRWRRGGGFQRPQKVFHVDALLMQFVQFGPSALTGFAQNIAGTLDVAARAAIERQHARAAQYWRWLVVLNFCLAVSLNGLMSQDQHGHAGMVLSI